METEDMDTANMNTQLGTKWFTFFTKVRPWLSGISIFSVGADFIRYTDVYFSHWWLLLYFIAKVALTVLGIMVFIKSNGNYRAFVSFVNKYLIFEGFALTYTQAVEIYIEQSLNLVYGGVMFVIGAVFMLFVWYPLNIKYFRKRLIDTAEVGEFNAFAETSARFCPKCGNRLLENSNFCSTCGNRII